MVGTGWCYLGSVQPACGWRVACDRAARILCARAESVVFSSPASRAGLGPPERARAGATMLHVIARHPATRWKHYNVRNVRFQVPPPSAGRAVVDGQNVGLWSLSLLQSQLQSQLQSALSVPSSRSVRRSSNRTPVATAIPRCGLSAAVCPCLPMSTVIRERCYRRPACQ